MSAEDAAREALRARIIAIAGCTLAEAVALLERGENVGDPGTR